MSDDFKVFYFLSVCLFESKFVSFFPYVKIIFTIDVLVRNP